MGEREILATSLLTEFFLSTTIWRHMHVLPAPLWCVASLATLGTSTGGTMNTKTSFIFFSYWDGLKVAFSSAVWETIPPHPPEIQNPKMRCTVNPGLILTDKRDKPRQNAAFQRVSAISRLAIPSPRHPASLLKYTAPPCLQQASLPPARNLKPHFLSVLNYPFNFYLNDLFQEFGINRSVNRIEMGGGGGCKKIELSLQFKST